MSLKTNGKICKINNAIYTKKYLWKNGVYSAIIRSKQQGGFDMEEPMYIRQTETESIMGDRIILYYFTKESRVTAAQGEKIRYGVGIDMYTQLAGGKTIKERKTAEDVFECKRDAENFIDILCRGVVTPATLEDIIADNVIA